MEEKIEQTLTKAGLSSGEIKVYLALLDLGSVTVGPIIKSAEVSNSKVYLILDKLLKKGLVNFITREKTKYFQASQPIALLQLVEAKEKEMSKVKTDLTNIIKKIEKQQASTEEGARIYKGYGGLKTGFIEAIKSIPSGGNYYFFSIGYGEDPYLQQFFRDFAINLKSRKIKLHGLADKKEKRLYDEYYKKFGYTMKYTNATWPTDIGVSGDYLLFFVWKKKEPVLYAIQSQLLVESYKNLFLSIWDGAKN